MFLPKKGALKPGVERIEREASKFRVVINQRKDRNKVAGLTLAEVAIALTIVLILFGIATPFYLNYKGRNGVNRAAEVAKALLDRSTEQARTAGSPLPDTLKADGLTSASLPFRGNGQLFVQLKKRLASGESAQVLSRKALQVESAEFRHLGLLDLEADTNINGIFLEFVQEDVSGGETLLASVPIDVNGEYVLAPSQGVGEIVFSFTDYSRTLEITDRGTSRLNQR